MASKTLLSAIELELFTHLASTALTASQIRDRLGLHPRAVPDFPDALLARGMLTRDGDGPEARYANTPETAAFLDKASPDLYRRCAGDVQRPAVPVLGGPH